MYKGKRENQIFVFGAKRFEGIKLLPLTIKHKTDVPDTIVDKALLCPDCGGDGTMIGFKNRFIIKLGIQIEDYKKQIANLKAGVEPEKLTISP